MKLRYICVVLESILILACCVNCFRQSGESSNGNSPCKTVAERVLKSGLIGAYVPTCKANGYYAPLQCHGSTGICWCSNELGEVLDGDDRKSTDCWNPCFKKILDNPPPTILIQGAPKMLKFDTVGPSCDKHGFFKPKQCSADDCWCVNKMGDRVKGKAC